MKRTRHGEPEIRRLLREAENALATGATIPQVCQKIGISEATFHRWRRRYGNESGAEESHRATKQDAAHRVKELERENKRLKQLVGQLMLDNAFLKDALEAKHRR